MSRREMIPLASFMATKTGSVNPANFPDEDFDLYSIPAFDAGGSEFVCGKLIGSPKQVVQPGDVLLSKIVPHIRRCWIVGPNQGKRIVASGEWIVFRPSGEIDAKYLRHVLLGDAFHAQFMNTVAGVGGSLLRARPAFVAQIEIPVPPVAEQRRIAQVLDHVDALRAKRREAIALLDDLTQSVFLDMFGDPVQNTMDWPTIPFGAACETRLGKMLDARVQTGRNNRPYLRNANVQWFSIDTGDLLEMDFDEKDRRTFSLSAGDILICEGGEPGRAAIWDGSIEECYFQKALHRARPHEQVATAEYIVHLLWFFSKRGGFKDHVSTATIAHLTGEKLRKMPIPAPPAALQKAFAERIGGVAGLRQTHVNHLAELDALFASLQQRAFQGELSVHASAA